jgi:hypothetical protein
MTPIAEILMAYADDELEPKARGEVLDALTRDPEVVRRLEVFLSTRAPLARLYQAPMREPVPERLTALFRDEGRKLDVPGGEGRESGAWLRRIKERFFVPGWGMVVAPAFSAALAIGLGTGWVLHGATVPPPNSLGPMFAMGGQQGLRAGGELQRVLESTPSGPSTTVNGIGGPVAIKIVHSFRSTARDVCRQYELETGSTGRVGGVACRKADGAWRIEIAATGTRGAGANPGAIRPAAPTNSPIAEVESTVDRIIAGDVLGAKEETQLMRNGWQANP